MRGPFVPLMMSKRAKQVDYEVKAAAARPGRRDNRLAATIRKAEKDAADRAAIVAALVERQLAKGDKAPVGNTGFLDVTGSPPSVSTSQSIPTRSRRRRNSMASSCRAPTPTSIRSKPRTVRQEAIVDGGANLPE